jgi:hypothetical protein
VTDPIDDLDLLDDDLEGDETDLFGLGLNIEPSPIDADLTAIRTERDNLANAIERAAAHLNPSATKLPAWAEGSPK